MAVPVCTKGVGMHWPMSCGRTTLTDRRRKIVTALHLSQGADSPRRQLCAGRGKERGRIKIVLFPRVFSILVNRHKGITGISSMLRHWIHREPSVC